MGKQTKSKGRSRKYSDEAIKEALVAHHGNVQEAARKVGCAVTTLLARLRNNPELRAIRDKAAHSYKTYQDEEIAEALILCHGNTSTAARVLGAHPQTLYKRIWASEELAKIRETAMLTAREHRKDRAEDNLDKFLTKGDWAATRFVLSTLGRDRGYSEHKDGADAMISTVELSQEFEDRLTQIYGADDDD